MNRFCYGEIVRFHPAYCEPGEKGDTYVVVEANGDRYVIVPHGSWWKWPLFPRETVQEYMLVEARG